MVARRLTESITPHGNESLILVGPPHSVRGSVRIRNHTDARRTARRGVVRSETLIPDSPGVVCQIGPTRVEPGEVVTTSVAFQLPHSTPPGEFDVAIEIGGAVVGARAVILEVVDTEITPSELVIEAPPDHTAHKRVAISNRGNVATTIGEIGAVVLDDEMLDCRTMRGALAELTERLVPVDHVLGAVARNAKSALDQAGVLRVHNASGRQTLEPGATVLLDLEIRVPSTLDKHTRYYGRTFLGTSDLTFRIVPGPRRISSPHADS